MFQCQDGSCLTKEKVCDGIPDCGQEEDELQCEKKVELTITIFLIQIVLLVV